MATRRSDIYHGMTPQRSLSSDERVSTHASLALISREIPVPITNSGRVVVRSPNNSPDSGVGMDEYVVSRAYSPDSFHNQEPGSLHDELFSSLIPTHQGKRGFFAKDQLSKILTETRVRGVLAEQFGDSIPQSIIEKHARKICKGCENLDEGSSCDGQTGTKPFIKVLAILIIIEKTKSILKFLEEDVNDSVLPLIKVSRPNGENLFDLRGIKEPDTALKCFENWNQLHNRNFEEWQWTTLPIEFARPTDVGEVKHLKLQEQEVLPFIEDNRDKKRQISRRTEFEGGFARVFQVTIHPQHHSFHQSSAKPGQSFFAVKRLHSQSEEAFQREVEILKKLSGKKHGHLITLLATYEQSDRFFLVFDWADADLQQYWRTVNPEPRFDVDTVTWMARQCKGIANGITKIHAHQSMYAKHGANGTGKKNLLFGHHGDIKPENVLWFDDSNQSNCQVGGTLKLSDFGLAEFSIHQTTSMPPKKKLGVSLAYRAPESDLQQGKAMGRSYDIWTLGCLYLEFITWMLGGSKLLDEFVEARKDSDAMWHDIETHTFFKLKIDSKTNKPTAVIKPAVKKFIKTLHLHRNCSQFIHDFLAMVENNLLVVKTSNPQGMDRFDINQVHSGLAAMFDRYRSDATYMTKFVPWSSS